MIQIQPNHYPRIIKILCDCHFFIGYTWYDILNNIFTYSNGQITTKKYPTSEISRKIRLLQEIENIRIIDKQDLHYKEVIHKMEKDGLLTILKCSMCNRNKNGKCKLNYDITNDQDNPYCSRYVDDEFKFTD